MFYEFNSLGVRSREGGKRAVWSSARGVNERRPRYDSHFFQALIYVSPSAGALIDRLAS
jgi:hypothetical protein